MLSELAICCIRMLKGCMIQFFYQYLCFSKFTLITSVVLYAMNEPHPKWVGSHHKHQIYAINIHFILFFDDEKKGGGDDHM